MKLNNILPWLVAAAILLTLAACGPRATPSPTPEPTATEQPTNTPEPTATATLEPTATQDLTAQPATQGTPGAAANPAVDPAAPAAPAAPAGGSTVDDDQYEYVSQTIADGYQVRPNTTVTITWRVKNVGSTAWDTNYYLNQYAGPTIKTPQVAFPRMVAANEAIDLTVTFTTPPNYGDHNLWFKLMDPSGDAFGDVNFLFTVTDAPDNSGKPQPSPTP